MIPMGEKWRDADSLPEVVGGRERIEAEEMRTRNHNSQGEKQEMCKE